jgi:hypothetical protein
MQKGGVIMAAPIIAAGAVGAPLLALLGVVLLFVVTEPGETMMLMLGAIVLAYLFMQ